MMERTIYEVLAAGREHVNENPGFLEDFFTSKGLTPAEVEQIRTFWFSVQTIEPDGSTNTGVSIIHQFPRDTTKFPAWAIVLVSGNEDKQFLGDEAGIIGDSGEDVFSSIWARQYAIFTYSLNPLITIYYHELLRFFLTRSRPYLKSSEGGQVLSSRFSEGDMNPDPSYSPANLFVRRMQIDLTNEEQVLGDPMLRGGSVRGIAGPPESPEDVQNVTSSIRTYIGGIDEDEDEDA